MIRQIVKKTKGVITVLVSLLLVGVLSIGTLTIEAGRYQAAKTQLAEASISASTSMIAAYDADLHGRFGLLAIDTERFTTERAVDYLNFNADQAVGYRGNRLARMYVMNSVELTGLYNLTYPSILKRQILSRAKFHVNSQESTLNRHTLDVFMTDFQNKCQFVAQRLDIAADMILPVGTHDSISEEMCEAIEVLYEIYGSMETVDRQCGIILSGATISQLPSSTGTVVTEVPDGDLADINMAHADASSVLGGSSGLSYNNGTAAAEVDVAVSVSFVPYLQSELASVVVDGSDPEAIRETARQIRELAQAFNAAINVLKADKDSNLLMNSYIAEYFSNRKDTVKTAAAPAKGSSGIMENANFVSACVEYVFGGHASEERNQDEAYSYVQAIRLINNLYAVISDSDESMQTSLYKLAALIAWANYETILDMELMTQFNVSVPFNKNEMILPLDQPEKVTEAFAEERTADGLKELGFYNNATNTFEVAGSYPLSYKESLAFALWFVPNSDKLMRVADLIQLEMRYREQYVDNQAATFLMSEQNTYCRLKCSAKFSAVLPLISLEPGNTARGIEFQTIKYAGY